MLWTILYHHSKLQGIEFSLEAHEEERATTTARVKEPLREDDISVSPPPQAELRPIAPSSGGEDGKGVEEVPDDGG